MLTAEQVRKAAERAARQPPAAGDAQFRALREAEPGEPVAVSSPAGEPAFWIVPFVRAGRAVGFARVDLSGRAGEVAVLGAPGGIDALYFAEPPAGALADIRAQHPGEPLRAPVFSYDEFPDRWGWRIEGRGWTAFIGPGGWYERPAGERRQPGIEG